MRKAGFILLRTPTQADASAVRQLGARVGGNARSASVLLASRIAETCLLAERGAELVGFVLAYRPPSEPSALVVWQLCVAAEQPTQWLAQILLGGLLEQPACRGALTLCTTIEPRDRVLAAAFRSFASARGATCAEIPALAGTWSEMCREPERLLRIGPLRA